MIFKEKVKKSKGKKTSPISLMMTLTSTSDIMISAFQVRYKYTSKSLVK
jgi:hypothetical protein